MLVFSIGGGEKAICTSSVEAVTSFGIIQATSAKIRGRKKETDDQLYPHQPFQCSQLV